MRVRFLDIWFTLSSNMPLWINDGDNCGCKQGTHNRTGIGGIAGFCSDKNFDKWFKER